LPIGSFVEKSEYVLRIFDRWGQKIYETTDPNKGWDGGSFPQDVYAYTLQYKTAFGEYKQLNGTVNLIR
jgi:gliding motility-associated-like protein